MVYNHFGPVGNYWSRVLATYFTDRYDNEWGDAINFDGPEPARYANFLANAAYWIEEFHLDGLRLDATQQIFDASASHHHRDRSGGSTPRGDPADRVGCRERSQETVNVEPVDQGGYGLDALWNDDFHHSAMVALTGRAEAYYGISQGGPSGIRVRREMGVSVPGSVRITGSGALEERPRSMQSRATFVDSCRTMTKSPTQRAVCRPSAHEPRKWRAYDCTTVAVSRDTDAVSRARIRGLLSVSVFRGLRWRARRGGSTRTSVLSERNFRAFRTSFAGALDHPGAGMHLHPLQVGLRRARDESRLDPLHQEIRCGYGVSAGIQCAEPRRADGAGPLPQAFLLRFFGGADATDRLLIVNLGPDLTRPSFA